MGVSSPQFGSLEDDVKHRPWGSHRYKLNKSILQQEYSKADLCICVSGIWALVYKSTAISEFAMASNKKCANAIIRLSGFIGMLFPPGEGIAITSSVGKGLSRHGSVLDSIEA